MVRRGSWCWEIVALHPVVVPILCGKPVHKYWYRKASKKKTMEISCDLSANPASQRKGRPSGWTFVPCGMQEADAIKRDHRA